MPDRHSEKGASNAERWINCPISVVLSRGMPDETSSYAEEGTIAHSVCEWKLRELLGGVVEDKQEPLDEEMIRCTDDYRNFIEEELNTAKGNGSDAILLIEQELDFGEYVPDSFGTSDAVIISNGQLEVIDFKYGKGVPVNAENNPQLRLYALGAYLALGMLYVFTSVKTTVFQPRLNSISSEELTIEELLDWADNVVKPAANLTDEERTEAKVGPWCRFCKAGSICRARVEEAFTIVDLADTNPALISDDEIPAILDKLDNAERWIEAIRKYAEEKAISEGKHWNGYKLVEGRTVRKISDQLGAMRVLTDKGYSPDEITTVKLKGIGELEKLLGKSAFNEVLGEYVVKPQGAPTLVKETDKRPEYNPVYEAFKED